MKTLGRETAGSVFAIKGVAAFLLLLMACLGAEPTLADITEKTFTRKSDGKKAKGQVFEPSRTITRQNSRRRRSRRHSTTVSGVVVPSLFPTSSKEKKKTPAASVVKSTRSAPRFGYGSEAANQAVSVNPDAPVSQPVYIFSPHYNNTQYYPALPYYYGYGYYSPFYPGSLYSYYGHYNPLLHHYSYSYQSSGFSFWFSH